MSIKIKFASNWDNSTSLAQRVERNWGEAPDGFEVVTEGDFDYLVSFNFSNEMFSIPKEKNIVFTMEPNWSGGIKDEVIAHSHKVFSSVDRFEGKPNVEMIPSLMFMEDTGGSTLANIKQHGESISKTMNDYLADEVFEKTKKCSMILAGHGAIQGAAKPERSLYLKREQLLFKILESDLDIDIYGRNWNISDPRYKGFAEYKEDALKQYDFSISIENSRENYYLSEKMTDCFINNCVPIYDGCTMAEKFYDPLSFERIDIESENVIEDIREILSEDGKNYQPYILKAKERYFLTYNIYQFLKTCV
jgi:hypothetical protein